jgi:hypothetical protein
MQNNDFGAKRWIGALGGFGRQRRLRQSGGCNFDSECPGGGGSSGKCTKERSPSSCQGASPIRPAVRPRDSGARAATGALRSNFMMLFFTV